MTLRTERTTYSLETIAKADLPKLILSMLQRLDELEIEVTKLHRRPQMVEEPVDQPPLAEAGVANAP